MRVLLTGGAGFIGSHVLDRLVGRGDEVWVLDDLSRGNAAYVQAPAKLVVLDICSEAAAACVRSFRPEAVVHLAAQMDVGASVHNPLHDARVNVLGTLNVLHAAEKAGCATFVAASSGGALYGDAAQFPTAEQAPQAPQSPYGTSKQCGEAYMELISRQTAVRCISLRLSNVFGPRQSHQGEAGVVAIFAERMLRGAAPVVYGDGEQTRDFVYVGDVADAFVRALAPDLAAGAYNVATGVETSLLQLAQQLANCIGFAGALQFAPGKPGEVRRSCLSAAKLQAATHWRAHVGLAQGLRRTVRALAEVPAAYVPLCGPGIAAQLGTRHDAVQQVPH